MAEEIEADLHLREYFEQWDIQDYDQVDLFRAADRSIILKLTNSLLIGSEEFSQYKEIISLRKTKHYRFKTPGGGQNFVHGGASLQEIVIPLINYRNDRKKDERRLISKVDVKLTNTSRKITNSLFSLDFFQTEKLSNYSPHHVNEI
jgi:hypothetical protein